MLKSIEMDLLMPRNIETTKSTYLCEKSIEIQLFYYILAAIVHFYFFECYSAK